MEAALPGKLINCEACKREIAMTAETCPHCGAVNNWIHPGVKLFVEKKDKLPSPAPFSYTHTKTSISGTVAVPIIKFRHFVFFWIGLIVVQLFCEYVFSYAVGEITGPFLEIIFGLSVAAMILFYITGASLFTNREKAFEIKFDDNKIQWQSNDDHYWAALRQYCLQNLSTSGPMQKNAS